MIGFAILLALADVFIVSQLSFWGVTPLLLAVLIYIFRYESRLLEVLTAATAYGYVASLFTEAKLGFIQLLGLWLATFTCMVLLRTIGQSRLRIRLRGYDGALFAVSFTAVYWLVLTVYRWEAFDPGKVVLLVTWSSAFNLALMMMSGFIFKKVSR